MKRSQKQTLSMYIHIPFCQKKCAYCDFLSFSGKMDHVSGYLKALINEIIRWPNKENYIIKTIFIGGGTPSVLTGNEILELFTAIKKNYILDKDCEISMECNPGTLTDDKIIAIKNSGINRISMGVQSLDVKMLEILGRIHNDTIFYQQYTAIQEAGFGNINLDFMYGLPHQTLAAFEKELDMVIQLQPKHLSVYGLIIEEGTSYEQLYEKNPDFFPNEEVERDMYWMAHKKLVDAGYEHYEISNYAKPGYRCRHNEVYWLLEPYISFGIGGSSFIDGCRSDHIKDLELYIRLKDNTKDMIDKTSVIPITNNSIMEEFMFLGLRRLEGISKVAFLNLTGSDIMEVYDEVIDTLKDEKLIIEDDTNIRLTERGIDISNYVMSQFLI
jgi:oxygen-independent coproporphyrinogen-3 oxidase